MSEMMRTQAQQLAGWRRTYFGWTDSRGQPTDDAAINEMVDRLAGPMRVDEAVDSDVDVLRSGGTWHVCDEGLS
jgi:hypothetical protein